MSMGGRSAVTAVVCIVCIIASAIAIILFYRTRASNAPAPVTVVTIDVDTEEVVEIVKLPGEKFPLTNPKTDRANLYEAYVCRDEKIMFPVTGVVTRCPSCRSMNVGGVGHNEDYSQYRVAMEYFAP